MLREALLAQTLVQLADTLVQDFDVVDMLTLLVDRCVEILDVDASGLMLANSGGDLRVLAASSEVMRVLELFELQAQEGPCLDAYRSGARVSSDDLTQDPERWPRFAAAALQVDFTSVHALPLRLRGTVIGALNLFRAAPGALDAADIDAGQALADIATIAILQYRATFEAQTVATQLKRALDSRIVIEQAKGVVAERTGVDMQQAFLALRSHARTNNLRLETVARSVIDQTLIASELDRKRAARDAKPDPEPRR